MTASVEANAERGEIALHLDGVPMVMRPSHEAIQLFEQATGKGLIQLTREALAGELSMGETAQVACQCIKAWGRATKNVSVAGVNADRIAELMMEGEGGFRAALATVAGLLALASTGGVTAAGELKPATGTAKTPDAG